MISISFGNSRLTNHFMYKATFVWIVLSWLDESKRGLTWVEIF